MSPRFAVSSSRGWLACVSVLILAASGVGAQQGEVSPPPTPAPLPRVDAVAEHEQVDEIRHHIDRLYRSVFELSAELGRSEDPERLAEIRRERREILSELRLLEEKLDEFPAPADAPPRPHSSDWAARLEDFENEVDWEALSRMAEKGLGDVGETLSELGAVLEGSEIEISPESFQFRDRSGSRVKIQIPDELRESLAEGLKEIQQAWEEDGSGSLREELRRLEGVFNEEGPRGIRDLFQGKKDHKKRHVVGGTRFRFGEDVEIADDEIIDGDVYVIGASAYIVGEVRGNVVSVFGDIVLEDEGEVENAVSAGGEISILDDSVVRGKMYDFGSLTPGLFMGGAASGGMGVILYVAWLGLAAVLLFIAFALAEQRTRILVRHGREEFVRDLLFGIFWLSMLLGGFVVASLGLAITVIGIPVVLVLTLAFVGVVLWAYFASCQLLGERLLAMAAGPRESQGWKAALLGLAILELPGLLAVSVHAMDSSSHQLLALRLVNLCLKLLAISVGIGALVATRLGGRVPAPSQSELSAGTPPA